MNVKSWAALSLGVWGAALSGCKEDDPIPAITQASLLAGPANQSKTWKLTSGSITFSGQPPGPFALTDCFGDNLYIFYNNASQDYEGQEGATKCAVSDPNVIEKGSWFFSIDGSTLIISADQGFSGNGLFYYFVGFPVPMKVIELTEEKLKLEADLDDPDKIVFEFTKQ
jgi:hypothetical protein